MPIEMVSNETVYLLLPEIILVLLGTAMYLGGTFTPAREGWSWMAGVSLVVALGALYSQCQTDAVRIATTVAVDGASAPGLLSGPVVVDLFSQYARYAVFGFGLLWVMLSAKSAGGSLAPEFMGSLLMLIAGLGVIAVAADLVLLFVGLELVSIPTYVLLYVGRRDVSGQESATKYFFLSILSSALLLYGMSFVYGLAGSTNLMVIHDKLAALASTAPGLAPLGKLAMVLIFAGLGFRITAAPFHFYAPDVYQGTSHANVSLLAVAPKFAGFIALVRLAVICMPGYEGVGWQISLALAVLTMTIGNVLALWQQNVRRLLAYSSIAHGGYMLIPLAVAFASAGGAKTADGINAIGTLIFYLLVYSASTIGAFAALTYFSGDERPIETVDDLAGGSVSHPKTSAALAIFMFSLAGLPPLAGFWGKMPLFFSCLAVDPADDQGLRSWFVALALIGVLNAAISAAYYLRVVAALYFRAAISRPAGQGGTGAAWAAGICAVLVVGTGLYSGTLFQRSLDAGISARTSFNRSSPPELKPTSVGAREAITPAEPRFTANEQP